MIDQDKRTDYTHSYYSSVGKAANIASMIPPLTIDCGYIANTYSTDDLTDKINEIVKENLKEQEIDLLKVIGHEASCIDYVNLEHFNWASKHEKENKKMPPKKEQDPMYGGYKYIPVQYYPKKIIYNPPATIVFWKDGTKTIVKCLKGETFNKYFGFCAALAKKLYGNNNRVNKIVNGGLDQSKTEKKEDGETAYKALVQKIMDLKLKSHCSYAEITRRMDMSYDSVRRIVKEEMAKCRKESKS